MYSAGAHRVAGHLMRIGHLGKGASAEAKAAYREDHKRAGLAGSHELPRGFTYVREHERGIQAAVTSRRPAPACPASR